MLGAWDLKRGIVMITMNRSLSLRAYKKELTALLGFVFTVFITISLYSYHITDSSWFYYSSHQQPVQNLCGPVGAYIAALLFFLLGAAAYLLVPLGIALSYTFTLRVRWRDEWERIVAAFGLLITIAALCTMHTIIVKSGVIGGGYVGQYIISISYRFFDRIGSLVLLYTGTLACWILIFRFSFIQWVQQLCAAVVYGYGLFIHYRVIQRMFYGMQMMARFAIRPLLLFARFSMRLLDGSAFEGTGLLNEEQEEKDQNFQMPLLQQQEHIISPLLEKQIAKPVEILCEESTQFAASLTDKKSYGLPNLDIFIGVKEKREDVEFKKYLETRAKILEDKLERFGIYGNVVSIKSGPVVTLFEYKPDIDTKLSKILALEDDLALALQALSIRILAPIPGRSVVGFEVSNRDRKDVLFAHVIQSPEYEQFGGSLPLILGKDTIGNDVVIDLVKMPHLLIAGSTGSGKSVALNVMLTSLLCKCTPDELKLILIDPKRLEFASYADIAHLLFPIVTDPKRSVPVLRWIVNQMEVRYEKMAQYSARNIFDYNTIAMENGDEYFPFIVVVIDELSDLMLTVGREVEDVILRITQMARAAGIHMIVATQRPSVDVITGLIKVNFPSRISFRVTSRVDSRTILDCGGADKLLGRGDMLFLDSTASLLRRIHGAFVSDSEINSIVSHIKTQQQVQYLDVNQEMTAQDSHVSSEDEDLYAQITSFLDEVDEVSISLLQRRFRIGYNRSARIIDMLQSRGRILPADGSRTRRVIR